MQKLHFKIDIPATKEKVWNSLWKEDNYKKWTSVFSEGSYAESDWKEGSEIKFLSPTGEGMYSVIEKLAPNDSMVFKHLGVMKEGKKQPIDDETKKWSGSHESYRLSSNGNNTTLNVEMDVIDEYIDYFKDVFPKALEKVKEISQ